MAAGLDGCRIALVLAGGNALGAYHAGVYQALHEAGIEPDWIVGTSAGAMTGAIVAGNAPDQRIARLAAFWRPAAPGDLAPDWHDAAETWRRTGEAMTTLLAGRAGMFAPVGTSLFGRGLPALYDTAPLEGTLAGLIDGDRLNDGPIRYTAIAVDLDTGAEAVFDTAERRVGVAHIRASGALPPAFPPVVIDGTPYVDGGVAANLPLDPVLAAPGDGPLLCIAVDLLPLAGGRPDTLGTMAARVQDLVFASQSRRTIAHWQARYAADAALRDRAVTLACVTYADQQQEVAGKAMDFSPRSVRRRWDAGRRDGAALIARLRNGAIATGAPGLHVHHSGETR